MRVPFVQKDQQHRASNIQANASGVDELLASAA